MGLRAVVAHQTQRHRSALTRCNERHEIGVSLNRHTGIHDEVFRVLRFKAVERGILILPALQGGVDAFPEVRRKRELAGIKHVGVVKHLVVEVVFSGDAERCRLDAHVDVFAHQHNSTFRECLGNAADGGQN